MKYNLNDSKHLGYIEGWVSIIGNTILFIFKYWAGLVTGSVALIADAWHTLSDSLSSIILLFGVKIAGKTADKDHPFGHGRAENIATIIIAILLALIALNFAVESIEKLIEHETVVFGTVAIVVTIISIVVKEAMAQFAFWAGRKANSQILKADGWHHRSDAISSVIILVGIVLGKYYWWIDGVLGLIVAGLIFYAAYEIFKESINPILGSKLDDKLVNSIKSICTEVGDNNLKAHHFHIHKYGNHVELTFHIICSPDETVRRAHNMASIIEKEIKHRLGYETTIHIEPDKSR